MELVVRPLTISPLELQPIEMVERKGLGHPDTICDALAEQLSVALCRFYQERFGCILHHNVDKALLWGGSAQPAFGGGQVLAPMEIFLAGRATREFKSVQVPVEELALESCRDWLRQNFHALDPDRHVKLHCLVRPGSAELAWLYARASETGIWLANDTSCGVGFAPMSPLEKVVYQVERQLNAPELKKLFPEIGEDIKVMGIRREKSIHLTIACALVDRFVHDIDDYCRQIEHLQQLARTFAQQVSDQAIAVEVNRGDDPQRGNIYLTVTGTSAEAGDDGQVGRGNRSNGLITPYRPMTLEAAAGKNPVTHVGKLYNVLARQIATAIVEEMPEIASVYCYLVSQIGRPVSEPQLIDLQIQTQAGYPLEGYRPRIEELTREHLSQIGQLWQGFIRGEFSIY